MIIGILIGVVLGTPLGMGIMAMCRAAAEDPSTDAFEREAGLVESDPSFLSVQRRAANDAYETQKRTSHAPRSGFRSKA